MGLQRHLHPQSSPASAPPRDDFAAAGARVLAISCDAMFTLRAFADAEDLPFDLLTDHWPHGAIARRYGIFDEQAGCSLRGSFVLDVEGRVIWRWCTASVRLATSRPILPP